MWGSMTLANKKRADKEKQADKEASSPVARAFDNAILRPLRESRAEMKNVVWPSREETTRLTIVVVVLSAIISALLFTADSVFALLLALLQRAVSGQ
jgi:preprotein translocase subunit SecE